MALAEEFNYLYVADRENGRVTCFLANTTEFHKEYRSPRIGTKIYSVAYAKSRLYLVNGPDPISPVKQAHVHGFVVDIDTGNVLSEFGPGEDMEMPHDITVTKDGREIYVVELNSHQIYKFLQGKDWWWNV